jgi:hypothetical protein
MPENQNIEYKSTWQDEYLNWAYQSGSAKQ